VVIVPDLGRQGRSWRLLVHSHPSEGLVVTSQRESENDKVKLPAIGHRIKARNTAEELAEARRLFYVACTRARDYLILSSAIGKQEKSETPLQWLLSGLGLDPKELTESKPLQGNGWEGRLVVRPVSGVPLAVESARAPSAAVASAPADPGMVRAMEARIRPIPLQHHARERFSVTQLTCYLDCPRRYELRYVLGVPEEAVKWRGPQSPQQLTALEFGDVVHRVLRLVGTGGSERLQGLVQGGLRLDAPLARRAGHELPRIVATVQAFLDTALYREVVEPARRLRTEMTVLVRQAGDPEYLLEGKLDALVEDAKGALHLLDYKTGEPSEEAVREHSLQLALYAGAVEDLRKVAPASAAVVYLTPEAARVHTLEAQAVPTARQQAREAVAGIREGRFEGSPAPRCVRCPLRWACPDARR
jgi:ATP-dependent exoDNAse (exonuclease V) beta subunit